MRKIGEWSPEKDEADLVEGYIVERVSEFHHAPGDELVQWNLDDTRNDCMPILIKNDSGSDWIAKAWVEHHDDGDVILISARELENIRHEREIFIKHG